MPSDIVTTFALARYLQDGSLDPGFGSGGIVITQPGVDESSLYGLVLDNGGTAVAVGAASGC